MVSKCKWKLLQCWFALYIYFIEIISQIHAARFNLSHNFYLSKLLVRKLTELTGNELRAIWNDTAVKYGMISILMTIFRGSSDGWLRLAHLDELYEFTRFA